MANLVLIITDRPGDASNLQQLLALARDGPSSAEWVRPLHEALYRIGADGILERHCRIPALEGRQSSA